MAEHEEKKRKRSLLFSSEMTGMLLALFSIIGLLCLITGDSVFFTVGGAVQNFFLGLLGFASYPVLISFLYLGIKLVVGFKMRVRGVKLGVTMFFVYLLLAGLIVQTATTYGELANKIPFGEYLAYCYHHDGAFNHTFGGAFFGLIAYPISLLLTPVMADVFYALNIIVITVLVFRKRFKQFVAEADERRERRADERAERELEKKTKEFESARKKAAARGVSGSVEYVKADKRSRYNAAVERGYYRGEQTAIGSADRFAENGFESAAQNRNDDILQGQGRSSGASSAENYPREFDGIGDSYHAVGLDGIYGNEKFNFKSKRDAQKTDDRERSLKLLFGDQTYYGANGGNSSNGINDSSREGYPENACGNGNYANGGYRGESARGFYDDRPGEVRSSKSYQSDYDDDMAAKLDYIRRPVSPDYREGARSPMGNDVPESIAIRNADRFEDVDESMPDRDVYVINDGKNNSRAAGGIRSFDLQSGRERGGRLGDSFNSDEISGRERGYNFSDGGDLSAQSPRKGDMRNENPRSEENRGDGEQSSFESLFGDEKTENTNSGERSSINGLKRVKDNFENSRESTGLGGDRLSGDRFGDDAAAADYSRGKGFAENDVAARQFSDKILSRAEQMEIGGLGTNGNVGGVAGNSSESATNASGVKPGLNISDERKLINPIDTIPLNYRYHFAPYNLMNDYRPNAMAIAETKREQESRKNIILQVLSNAKISAQIVDVKYGPALTRFELTIPDDVSVKRVTELQKDFNFRIAAHGTIRIVAPIPGTSRIGIEVPNSAPATVGLKELVMDQGFKNAKKSSLTFCLGKDLVGSPVNLDLSKMPHLLVAGATGTGKSVFLNTLLISLMYKYTPEELRIVLVDPKIVEFSLFKGTPNLLFDEIITETPKACAMLDWACKEMDDRYRLLNENLVKNVDEYNSFMASKGGKPLYKILIIIDEFADLMATSNDKKNIENKISRIAAKARAAGIHLIMATQRPSVDIMEGSIKTNFTSRVAFKMSSPTDAQVIMGEIGAEKLLGRGDVLYRTSNMMSTERAQGAFIDTPEIDAICRYLKEHNKCYYNEFALDEINKNIEKEEAANAANATDVLGGESGDSSNKSDEEIVKNAMRLAINNNNISISMMQRRLGLGYPRAGKIMDILVDRKYVSDSLNSRNREINMTKEEFETVFGEPFDASQKQ
ncbi:MAG: DNA translocase FtsK [Candidatus Borkfalkiaceae bacterium]|nr:DNA translocase FtsK [Christensenellaceae bacterium]